MKALLLRELKRQGFYALGPCAVLLASPFLARGLTHTKVSAGQGPAVLWAPEVWLLLLAGLLGVAAVAPERGSGAQAFLRRVPLSLQRSFALRLAAGGLWLGLGLALAIGALALQAGPLRLNSSFVLAWPMAYAAGLVSSTVTQRPLAAIGLAIPVGALATLTYFGPLLVTGLRPRDGAAVVGLLLVPTAVTLGAAFLAYRHGRIHLEGLRPFAISLSALLGFSLLGSGGTALARSAHQSVVFESLQPMVASGRSELSLVTLTGTYWYGWEQRVVVLRPDQEPLALPRAGARSPQLSPDGRQVLVRGDSITTPGALCDLESGEVRELNLGYSEARDVLWGPNGPALVSLATAVSLRVEGAVEPGQARKLLLIPCDEIRTLSSDDQGRVYLLQARSGLQRLSGLDTVELPSVEPGQKAAQTSLEGLGVEVEQLPFPEELWTKVRGLRISRGGELGLVLFARGDLALLEIKTGRLQRLPSEPAKKPAAGARSDLSAERRISARDLAAFVDPRQVLGRYRLSFGPGGRGVVVERDTGWTIWCDLEQGFTRTSLELRPDRGLPSWAADGHAVLLGSGRVWEAEQRAPRALEARVGRPLSWLGSKTLVTEGLTSGGRAADLRSLTLFDLDAGRGTQPLGGAK